jgi:hypothetical protein
VQFCVFIPLKAAVRRSIFKIITNQEIAPKNREFPVFRGGLIDPNTNKVATWWFYDGKKEWKVGQIAEEQRKLPQLEAISDTQLIEQIESGRRSENDPW